MVLLIVNTQKIKTLRERLNWFPKKNLGKIPENGILVAKDVYLRYTNNSHNECIKVNKTALKRKVRLQDKKVQPTILASAVNSIYKLKDALWEVNAPFLRQHIYGNLWRKLHLPSNSRKIINYISDI